jgi:uncharacterized protein (DUF305 family)
MHRPAIAPLLLAVAAACGGARATTREAATTTASVAPAPVDTARVRRGYTATDVRFMHHMLMHHEQALVMTAMVPSRSTRDDIQRVAERIAVSQRDEMALMQRWLRARGEAVPADMDHAHHAGMSGMSGGMSGGDGMHGMTMPGMLTPAELARLEASSGAAFDSLFLAGMIRHHEGALTMVKDYLAAPGAAQESEIFRFASDVDADQRAEIRRLRALMAP